MDPARLFSLLDYGMKVHNRRVAPSGPLGFLPSQCTQKHDYNVMYCSSPLPAAGQFHTNQRDVELQQLRFFQERNLNREKEAVAVLRQVKTNARFGRIGPLLSCFVCLRSPPRSACSMSAALLFGQDFKKKVVNLIIILSSCL